MHRHRPEAVVLLSHTFKPREELDELEDWAERRNHDRELDELEKRVEQTDMQERASEKTAAAVELAAILNQHQTPI